MSFDTFGKNMEIYFDKFQETAVKVLEIEGDRSVKENFASQGRPEAWKEKANPDGRAILTGKTGRLLSTTSVVGDYNLPGITIRSTLPYSQIHNEGGVINMPARSYKFRYKDKSKGSTNKQVVYARSTRKRGVVKETQGKAYKIEITARRYAFIPEIDGPRIEDAMSSAVKGIRI